MAWRRKLFLVISRISFGVSCTFHYNSIGFRNIIKSDSDCSAEELVAFRTDLHHGMEGIESAAFEPVNLPTLGPSKPASPVKSNDMTDQELESQFHSILAPSGNMVDIQETLILKKLAQLNNIENPSDKAAQFDELQAIMQQMMKDKGISMSPSPMPSSNSYKSEKENMPSTTSIMDAKKNEFARFMPSTVPTLNFLSD